MNCNSSHSLFLRSNGILVCWDDAGSSKEILAFDDTLDYANDVYLGPIYEGIRQKLRSGEMPFPDHCAKCFCLMTQMPMDNGIYVREKRIATFQIEPSMGCQLECPGCIPRALRKTFVRKTAQGQLTLDPSVLYKIVLDFHRAGIKVDKFDMQGHGEPTLHKQIWRMCSFIATLYPKSIISICTHGGLEFAPHMVLSGVNEMLFAIDGVDQPSYAPYRVHGRFEQAFAFMRQFSRLADEEMPHISRVWKYVVFAHNDSDEQLRRAQELALDAKVTELRFVLTQLGPVSSRISDGSEIPRIDSALKIVVVNYKIQLEQLQFGLLQLKKAISRLNIDGVRRWADYLATSILGCFERLTRCPIDSSGSSMNFVKRLAGCLRINSPASICWLPTLQQNGM